MCYSFFSVSRDQNQEEAIMRIPLALLVLLAAVPIANAADIEAGRAKAAVVCAACHGALGVSVSDTIPNLAGQKTRYLEGQLKALKAGTRKSDIMSAIATQLSLEEITNIATHYSAQASAAAGAKSEYLPNLVKTGVEFPENYKTAFAKYYTINFPDTRQVRYYYANDIALKAAMAGKSLPDGSVLFAEIYSTRLDAEMKPVTGADGFFAADQLVAYTAMARETGWGREFPDMLRNEDWNYAVFTTEKKHRPGVNQAECLACHKPLDKVSYTFTLKQLTEVAKEK
jgi:cytochrome c553